MSENNYSSLWLQKASNAYQSPTRIDAHNSVYSRRSRMSNHSCSGGAFFANSGKKPVKFSFETIEPRMLF